MAMITLGLAVVPSGSVQLLDTVPGKLDNMDRASKKATGGMSGLADGIGRVSTTLARSVGVLGMSSDSLRALDDAADLAELSLKGAEGGLSKVIGKADLMSGATLGAAGAAGALGFALGSWIAKFPAVAAAADKITFALMGVSKEANKLRENPPGFDQKEVAASHAEAKKKQLEWAVEVAKSGGKAKNLFAGEIPEAVKKTAKAFDEATAAAKRHEEEIQRIADHYKSQDIAKEADTLNAAVARLGPLAAISDQRLIELGDNMAKLADAGQDIPGLTDVFAELARRGIDPASRAARELAKDLDKLPSNSFKFQSLATVIGGVPSQRTFHMGDTSVNLLEEARKKTDDVAVATFDWAQQLENVANMAATLPGLFGKSLSAILGGVSSIGSALKLIPGSGTGGGGLSGLLGMFKGGGSSGLGKLGSILGGASVVGQIIGGAVGLFKGIKSLFGGDDKEKAEELKRKQQAAIDSFTDLYKQWEEMRREIAGRGASGVGRAVGAMFKDGKLDESLTSAANAADYVFATFTMLQASGMSAAEALSALGPAVEEMLKDPKKFKGTAAEPLLQMSKFAGSELGKRILAFQSGLGDMAVALASFGQLTQELTDKLSADIGASIERMVKEGGLSLEQALALSAQSLYNLDRAAEKSGTTLDARTQQLVNEAKSKGLFEGLQDPMERLVQLNEMMVVAMGQVVSLMGGQVPAAIQEMIDAFNNAQFKAPSGTDSGSDSGPDSGDLPQKGGGRRDFQHGGFVSERPGGEAITVARPGTGGELMVPGNKLDQLIAALYASAGRGGDVYLDGTKIGELLGDQVRAGGSLLTSVNEAQRRRGGG